MTEFVHAPVILHKKSPAGAIVFLFLFVCFFSLPYAGTALGSMAAPPAGESGYVFVELGGGSDPDVIGGSVGVAQKTGSFLAVHGALSFLASENSDDYYGGASLGIRTDLSATVAPFLGVGVFAGYTEKNVAADDDEVDNDKDGKVDEEGEEKEVIDNAMATFYPELGLMIRLDPFSRVMFTARYNYSSEGRDHDFWIYTLGFTYSY